MPVSEKDLILRAAQGDTPAFEDLFRGHFEAVFNYALLLAGDPAEAEDLTQGAFIRAHAGLSRLGSPWRFRAWVFRLTRNLFLDTIRRGKPESDLQEEMVDDGVPTPEAAALRLEDAERVRRALHIMPPTQRETLVLREVYDLSYADIAGVLGVSNSNVKIRLHRARASFQEAYGLSLLLEEPTDQCGEFSQLLGGERDGELAAAQLRALHAHLESCGACRERRDRLAAVGALIGLPGPILAPAGLAEKILNSLLRKPLGVGPEPSQPASGAATSASGGEWMSGKARLLPWGCLVAIVFGVTLAAAYAGLGSFRAYSAQGEPPIAGAFQAWFVDPANGSEFPVDSMVLVQARADGPHPIGSMELWVDGQVVEVVGAPSGEGLVPFPTDFHWQPDELGTYQLVSRAHTLNGETATSPALYLNIVEVEAIIPGELAEAYSANPSYALPSGPGGGGIPSTGDEPPTSPPSDEPGGDGEVIGRWQPTLIGWLQNLAPGAGPPTAPKITPAVEGCKIRLFISDNSDNETGFRVYRRDPGGTEFSLVATLAAHVGPTFTYEDLDMYGSYSYYVSAFNPNGEAPSNIAVVDVTSPNCAPSPAPVLVASLFSITPALQPAMGYCYYSFDDMHWQRHPADPDTFLPPGADGFGLDGLGEFASINDDAGPVKLAVECWGWIGGALNFLGEWETYSGDGGPPSDTDPAIDIGIDPRITTPDFQIEHFIPTASFRVPVPTVWIGRGAQQCADWSNIPNPIILGLICGDVADDIDFAVWDLLPCLSFGQATCFGPDDITKYRVYDTQHNYGQSVAHTVKAPATLYFLIDERSCESRNLWVSAVVEKDGETYESFPSQVVYYPGNLQCPYAMGLTTRHYRITWDTIDFSVGNIDDGADAEDDVEGYGYLRLVADGGFETFWNLSEMSHSIAEAIGSIPHNQVYEFEDDPEDNPKNWHNIMLEMNHYGPCMIVLGCNRFVPNNDGDFNLYRDESAYVQVRLWDADPDHPDDKICHATSGPINDGLLTSQGGIFHGTLNASHSSAACEVTYTIEALP